MQTRLVIIHALTPMHPGTGQGTGHIDLPIQRERASRHPLLPGSSLKGCLRDLAEARLPRHQVHVLFGPDFTQEADSKTEDGRLLPQELASALRFSDARVLLFPVQSDRGTFAWVTCPYVIERLRRDAQGAAGALDIKGQAPRPAASACLVATGSDLVQGGRVVLDGLAFSVETGKDFDKWATNLATRVFPGTDPQATLWQDLLRRRLCIVDDDSFTWFVEQATEVRARVRINDATGTVKDGMLWYEEALPAETVLVGLVQHVPQPTKSLEHAAAWTCLQSLVEDPMQLGGKATTGHGLARVHLLGGAA